MRRVLAGMVTGIVLIFALWMSRGRIPFGTGGGAVDPESCVERMFSAAEVGDVARYLDCFTGPERERLDRELQTQPREKFAESLIEAISQLKGRALYPSADEPASDTVAAYTLERIYEGRSDRQDLRLVRDGSGWRIHTVRAAQAIQPAVPYGTPVFEMPE